MKYTGCHEGLSERNKYKFQTLIKPTVSLSAFKTVYAAQIQDYAKPKLMLHVRISI